MSGNISSLVRGGGLFYAAAATMVGALLLGGGTRSGFLGDAILQYFSLAVLGLAVAGGAATHETGLRRALWFCAALAIVPLLQLVPLPPGVRGLFAGKQWIADAYALLDRPPAYWPLSLAPHATWLSLLSLIPPVGMFLGTLVMGYHDRRRIAFIILVFCYVSVFVGLLQLAQGPQSALRFFDFTNVDDAVAFFANRNHFAALLYCGTMLSACWALNVILARNADAKKAKVDSRAILSISGSLVVFAILVIAQAMARSRAGLTLSMVALLAVLPMILTDRRSRDARSEAAKIIYAVATVAAVFSLQFALYRILSRFGPDALADTRLVFARNTLEAARAYLPFGSGMGSFLWVYPQFEKPADITHFFANRAHNDIAEAALEAGIPALMLMIVFLYWFVRQAIKIWGGAYGGIGQADLALMKAATVIVLLLVLHSFVDYPLRTSAMACVAAFSCGLLLPPRGHSHGHHHHHHDDGEVEGVAGVADEPTHVPRAAHVHRPSAPKDAPPAAAPASQSRPAPRPHQRWDAPVEWPAEWQGKPDAMDSRDGAPKPARRDEPKNNK